MIGSFLNVRRIPGVFTDSSYGRQWGNLLTLGTIHLSPREHPLTPKFIQYLEIKFPGAASQVLIRTHADHEEAMEYVMSNLDEERTWAVIDLADLANGSDDKKGGSFTIRLNYTTVPNTALIENYVALGLSTTFQRYYLSGYLTLQRTINDFVMEQDGCDPQIDPFYSMPMPTAEYEQNVFFMHVGYLLGLVLVMAFLYPTSRLIQGLVEERETRMKETLLILGVRPWAHTASWILTTSVSFLFITMLMSIILRQMLVHQTFLVIWFWMGLFSMASMSFCFFLASFFSKAKLAAVIGPMALFASLLPRFIFFGTNRYEAVGAKYIASILPGVALAFGADIMGDYEYGEQPVKDNLWVGTYSFGSSLCFLLFDTVFYMVLAWYTEQIIPREFGAAPKPWYFPLVGCVPSLFSSSDKTLADSVSEDDLSLTGLDKTKGAEPEW
jgi:ABC-2 family transporter protein